MHWHVNLFVIGAVAALSDASAVRLHERRTVAPANPRCTSPNVAIVLKVLKTIPSATTSSYCSKLLCTHTSTATATATTVRTVTVTATNPPLEVSNTVTATSVATVVSPVTVTNAVTVTPPPVTATATVTVTTVGIVVATSYSTQTICTGIGLQRRDALPTAAAALDPRHVTVPKELQRFAEALIREACGCYQVAPTVTRTVTTTATAVATVTNTVRATVTNAVTQVITATVVVPTTVTAVISQILDPVTVTATQTATEALTQVSTLVVPTTTNIVSAYSQAFSGNRCVYNEYTNFYVLAAPNFADAKQQCACNCNMGPNCRSFFIYYSPPTGRFGEEYDCTLDNVPYNSAFLQCNVYFAAQGEAYNKIV